MISLYEMAVYLGMYQLAGVSYNAAHYPLQCYADGAERRKPEAFERRTRRAHHLAQQQTQQHDNTRSSGQPHRARWQGGYGDAGARSWGQAPYARVEMQRQEGGQSWADAWATWRPTGYSGAQ